MAYYHVSPRFTPGSPAMVDYDTAARVAEEEKRAHGHSLTGVYGIAERERAERVGLAGIVEARTEERRGWRVHDLITGETYVRPFPRRSAKLTQGPDPFRRTTQQIDYSKRRRR